MTNIGLSFVGRLAIRSIIRLSAVTALDLKDIHTDLVQFRSDPVVKPEIASV
jgi:hypothetical protein